MALRLSLTFLVAFVALQLLTYEGQALVVRREAPADNKNSGSAIDEALQSAKDSFDDFVNKIQENELLQNASSTVQHLLSQVKSKVQEAIKNVENDGKN